jgi:hypothetical protein
LDQRELGFITRQVGDMAYTGIAYSLWGPEETVEHALGKIRSADRRLLYGKEVPEMAPPLYWSYEKCIERNNKQIDAKLARERAGLDALLGRDLPT